MFLTKQNYVAQFKNTFMQFFKKLYNFEYFHVKLIIVT